MKHIDKAASIPSRPWALPLMEPTLTAAAAAASVAVFQDMLPLTQLHLCLQPSSGKLATLGEDLAAHTRDELYPTFAVTAGGDGCGAF